MQNDDHLASVPQESTSATSPAQCFCSSPPSPPMRRNPSTADSATQPRRAAAANTVAAVGGVAACAAVLAYTLTVREAGRTMTGSALVTAVLTMGLLARKIGWA